MPRNTLSKKRIEKDAGRLRALLHVESSPSGTTDHGGLLGLGDDDHSQYAHLSQAESVVGQWDFAPVSSQAPFTLSANAQGQTVTGFDADTVDGSHASDFAPKGAEYLVLTLDGTLTDERVLVDGDGLTGTDGGAGGNYTLDVDLATPSGLSFSVGELQIDDSLAGAGLSIAAKVISVDATAGTYAPKDAEYLVLLLNGTLTDERVLVDGDGLTGTDGGAGGNYTLALTTPGTLSVSSTNNASGSHTHEITSSSNPGAAAEILASDSSGYLQLQRLGIQTSPSYGLDVGTDAYFAGDVVLTANAIGTDSFVSQTTGWQVQYDGDADFRSIYADEMHVQAFIADIYEAFVGAIIVTKSRAKLSRDFTVPWGKAISGIDGDVSAASIVDIDGNVSGAAITGVVQGSKIFKIAGDQTAYIEAGQKFTVAGSTGNDGVYTVVSDQYTTETEITVSETIPDSTVDGTITFHHWFSISGDETSNITVGDKFTVAGSTGNNGTYTVASRAYVGGYTDIETDEAIPDFTTDGTVTFHHYFSVAGDQTSKISASDTFEVHGSTGNDNTYTVSSVYYDSGDVETDIYPTVVIPDSTADGGLGKQGTIYVEDLEGWDDTQLFAASDFVLLRYIDRTGGGLIVTDVWGAVSSYSDLSGGEQSYTFAATDDGGIDGSIIYRGAIALDYGASGDGLWEATVLDAAGAPYSQVQTWATNPWTGGNWTTHVRLGQLDGIAGIGDEHGLWAGQGTGNTDAWILLSDQNVEFHNIPIEIHNGVNATILMNPSTPYFSIGNPAPTAYGSGTGIWMGKDTLNYRFRVGNPAGIRFQWDGTNVQVGNSSTGDYVQVSSGGIGLYSNAVKTISLDTSGNATLGNVATNQGNAYWNTSNKRLEFRGGTGGTVVEAYIDSDGSIVAGGGVVTLDTDGISVDAWTAAGDQTPYNISFMTGSTELSKIYHYYSGAFNYLTVAVNTHASLPSRLALQANAGDNMQAEVFVEANSYEGVDASLTIHSDETDSYITFSGEDLKRYVDAQTLVGGLFIPITATDLYDNQGTPVRWTGSGTITTGTYVFEADANGNDWLVEVKAVILFFGGNWASASDSNILSVRKQGGSINEGQVRAQTTYFQPGFAICSVDANGDFEAIVTGASMTTPIMRMVGYIV